MHRSWNRGTHTVSLAMCHWRLKCKQLKLHSKQKRGLQLLLWLSSRRIMKESYLLTPSSRTHLRNQVRSQLNSCTFDYHVQAIDAGQLLFPAISLDHVWSLKLYAIRGSILIPYPLLQLKDTNKFLVRLNPGELLSYQTMYNLGNMLLRVLLLEFWLE